MVEIVAEEIGPGPSLSGLRIFSSFSAKVVTLIASNLCMILVEQMPLASTCSSKWSNEFAGMQ